MGTVWHSGGVQRYWLTGSSLNETVKATDRRDHDRGEAERKQDPDER